MGKNDITGDKLISRPNNDKFNENFERIFGKPKSKPANKDLPPTKSK